LIPLPPTGTTFDMLNELKTSGWGYGAAAGIFIEPIDGITFGANYRSKISKTLSGSGTFATLGNFDADLTMVLPTLVTAGFAAQVMKKLQLSFQYDYERNSEIKQFVVTSSNLGGTGATLTIPENWRDSHTLHMGVKYDVCSVSSLIAGYAKDFEASI